MKRITDIPVEHKSFGKGLLRRSRLSGSGHRVVEVAFRNSKEIVRVLMADPEYWVSLPPDLPFDGSTVDGEAVSLKRRPRKIQPAKPTSEEDENPENGQIENQSEEVSNDADNEVQQPICACGHPERHHRPHCIVEPGFSTERCECSGFQLPGDERKATKTTTRRRAQNEHQDLRALEDNAIEEEQGEEGEAQETVELDETTQSEFEESEMNQADEPEQEPIEGEEGQSLGEEAEPEEVEVTGARKSSWTDGLI